MLILSLIVILIFGGLILAIYLDHKERMENIKTKEENDNRFMENQRDPNNNTAICQCGGWKMFHDMNSEAGNCGNFRPATIKEIYFIQERI